MFRHEPYINLRTFRKDLRGVDTPVWFVRLQGQSKTLYVFTNKFSGKLKRIKNNNIAEICVCDFKGKATSDWVKTKITTSTDFVVYSKVIDACKKKYGWKMHILNFFSELFNRRMDRAIIEIHLKSD